MFPVRVDAHNLLAVEETLQEIYDTISNKIIIARVPGYFRIIVGRPTNYYAKTDRQLIPRGLPHNRGSRSKPTLI